jgi:hypothetical protein
VVKILALLTKQASGKMTQGFDSILRKRKACKKPVTIALTPKLLTERQEEATNLGPQARKA